MLFATRQPEPNHKSNPDFKITISQLQQSSKSRIESPKWRIAIVFSVPPMGHFKSFASTFIFIRYFLFPNLRITVDVFLCIAQVGICTVYVLFVAQTLEQVRRPRLLIKTMRRKGVSFLSHFFEIGTIHHNGLNKRLSI